MKATDGFHQLSNTDSDTFFGFCCRFLVLKELISQLYSYLGCWCFDMTRK